MKSGGGTPILPLAYSPAFDGTGYASGSSTIPLAFGSSQPTAFVAAASGAVGQLTAYFKRQCDRSGGPEAEGGSSSVISVGAGGVLGQRSARLLSARGGDGGGGESGVDDGGGGGVVGVVGGRVAKRAKKEERLMKNREAANRSRAKVGVFRVVSCNATVLQ